MSGLASLALALLVSAGPADASPEESSPTLRARDTAELGPKGSWSIGLFDPAKLSLSDQVEFEVHPILFPVAPNLVLRVGHGSAGAWRFAGEYGVSMPTPALGLFKGFLFPSWDKSNGQIGWFVVPSLGLVASRPFREADALTLRLDGALGIPLSRNDATALMSVAPLNVLLAPVFSGWRARLGALYDLSLHPRWRIRAWVNLWTHGAQPSYFTTEAGLGVDLRIGRYSRLTLGAAWWNDDEHEIDAKTHERVRSNSFWPSLDFIWAGF